MSKPNSNIYALETQGTDDEKPPSGGSGGGSGSELRDSDYTLFLCHEFLNLYPLGYLGRVTAWWIFILLIAATVDVATMYQLIGTKFTDAFGIVNAPQAVIVVAAMLTLMVFLLISFLWKKGD